MMDAEQVQHGGMEIMRADDARLRCVAHGVGAAMSITAFHAATGHPHGVAAAIVTAAVVGFVVIAAATTEFTAPEDQRVLEHVALLQVGDEAGDGFVDGGALARQVVAQAVVMIPSG